MREDRAELRLLCRSRMQRNLDQIRPQGLVFGISFMIAVPLVTWTEITITRGKKAGNPLYFLEEISRPARFPAGAY